MRSPNQKHGIFSVLPVILLSLGLISSLFGCNSTSEPVSSGEAITVHSELKTTVGESTPTTPVQTTEPPSTTKPANPEIILATTTSVQDSGLLDVLIPIFEQKTGYKVKTIAVGTGTAIAMGQRGEADVIFVHDPSKEVPFMDSGAGMNRKLVAHNYFIIAGPASDPAGIKGMTSVVDAFKKIAAKGSTFISRGDASGTNSRELQIWKLAGITPKGQGWYQESGQGMGATLNIAAEKNGYTLSDRGTYLATRATTGLNILLEGTDSNLMNIYHVIQVNPTKFDKVNGPGGRAFVVFMIDPETQAIIANYGVDKYGEVLFFADATKTEADLGSY